LGLSVTSEVTDAIIDSARSVLADFLNASPTWLLMDINQLFVKLEAKPGKENEVAKFLRNGQGLVQQEPATIAWFGIRLGPTTFADAFADDAGRDAHLSGKIAKALMEKAPELLAEPPKIEKADVLADRLLG
jgi:quinol monooxygenase YgiN